MLEATRTDSRDRRGAGLVLYVEGEEAMRRAVKAALETFGFSVLLAQDGREGVQAFRRRADDIRLVVLDLNLPDGTGADAAQEIRQLRPRAHLLFLSKVEEEARARFAGMDQVDFIQKPFHFLQLIEQVQAAYGTRRYPRLPVSLPLLPVIAWVAERAGVELRGTLHCMGQGGLEVEFPEAVPPGTLMRLALQTRGGPIALAVEGKVVSSRPAGDAFRHGLAFLKPKDFLFALDLYFRESS